MTGAPPECAIDILLNQQAPEPPDHMDTIAARPHQRVKGPEGPLLLDIPLYYAIKGLRWFDLCRSAILRT